MTPLVLNPLLFGPQKFKLASGVCFAIAAILLLPGCERTDSQVTTVNFWAIGSEVEKIGELFDEFARENPDVKVRVQQISWLAAHEKLLTAFAGDATPDVCQLGNTWIPEFATLDALEPLDPYLNRTSQIDPGDYFPGLWKTNQINGQTYGIPWYADTRVLFYRKDILQQAGWTEPPKTWDEWIACMRDIKRKNPSAYAMLMPTNEWEHLTILSLQTGTDMLRDNGQYGNFTSQSFRYALAFYARVFDEGLAPPVRNTEISNYWDEFARGYFAMYITGPWNIGEFRRRLPESQQNIWSTAPIPYPPGAKFSVSQAGGCGLSIFRRSSNKVAAWKLIEFLSRPENLVRFYKLTGNMPPRESAWKLGDLRSDPIVNAFHEQLEHAMPTPRVPEWEQITTKIMQAGESVAQKRKTNDEVIVELDNSVNELLTKRRWLLARQLGESH